MQDREKEQLYVLRLWQDEAQGDWRASLKKMSRTNEVAKYFHSIESLTKFLATNSIKQNIKTGDKS
jgi:hypothetical protein